MAKQVTVQYLPDYTYSQLLTAGHHTIVADEPEVDGGDGLGPGPYELLLWALGSCTVSTLLMYARRKGWDLAGVAVDLTHDRVHAADAGESETKPRRVELIKRNITLQGDINDKQRERLLEIAGRCPMSRTLASETKVVDSAAVSR